MQTDGVRSGYRRKHRDVQKNDGETADGAVEQLTTEALLNFWLLSISISNTRMNTGSFLNIRSSNEVRVFTLVRSGSISDVENTDGIVAESETPLLFSGGD